MPTTLTEEQKKTIAQFVKSAPPSHREALLNELSRRDLDFDVYEYMPINWQKEARRAKEGFLHGATLGWKDMGPPDPEVGDIKLPFDLGEVQPAGVVGEALGVAVPTIAGYFTGGATTTAAAARVGVGVAARFGPAALRAGAVPAKVARKAGQMVGGEALPGGLYGYIQSDGDWDKALAMSAEWLATGIIAETAFVGIARAVKKARAGKKLNKKDRSSLAGLGNIITARVNKTKDKLSKGYEEARTKVSEAKEEFIEEHPDFAVTVAGITDEATDLVDKGLAHGKDILLNQPLINAYASFGWPAVRSGLEEAAAEKLHRVRALGDAVYAATKRPFTDLVDAYSKNDITIGEFIKQSGDIFDASVGVYVDVGDGARAILRREFDDFNRDILEQIKTGEASKADLVEELEDFLGRLNNLWNKKDEFSEALKEGVASAVVKGKNTIEDVPIVKVAREQARKEGERVSKTVEEARTTMAEGAKEVQESLASALDFPLLSGLFKALEIETPLEKLSRLYGRTKAVSLRNAITTLRDDIANSQEALRDITIGQYGEKLNSWRKTAEELAKDAAEVKDSAANTFKKQIKDLKDQLDLVDKKYKSAQGAWTEARTAARQRRKGEEYDIEGKDPIGETPEEVAQLSGRALELPAPVEVKTGDFGTFRLTDDPDPISGRVLRVEDDVVTLEVNGKEWNIDKGQIERFVEQPTVRGGGGVPRDEPITAAQSDEIKGLLVEYRKWFDEEVPLPSPASLSQARTWVKNVKESIFTERGRRAEDTPFFDDIPESRDVPIGDPLDPLPTGAVDNKAWGDSSKLPWVALKLTVPYSKWGPAANPYIKEFVWKTLHAYEEVGSRTANFLDRYKKALEPLGLTRLQRASAASPIGGGESKKLMHEYNRKKILLSRALDGDRIDQILKDNPDLVAPYRELRSILDDLADYLRLQKGERIAYYFPHIFNGQLGKYMAGDVAGELGRRGRWLNEEGIHGKIPTQRLFQHLLERKGAEGFDLDLDAAFYAYIRGSVRKRWLDGFLNESKSIRSRLLGRRLDEFNPDIDDDLRAMRRREEEAARAEGPKALKRFKRTQKRRENTAEYFEDWVKYIAGVPMESRVKIAQWWENSTMFNHWTDKLVAYLGDAESSDFITKARLGRIKSDGSRGDYSAADTAQARNFFLKLVEDANKYTNEGILKDNLPKGKQRRAQLALKVEEIRNALQDPNAAPVVISNLFGLMVVNKLALNGSHAIINLTQTIANTIPSIGLTHSARGMARYLSNKQKRFDTGFTTEEVLDELKVLADTPEAQEFVRPGIGMWNELMDGILMAPARITERFNRGVAGLAGYEKLINSGRTHSEAIQEARELVLRTQFPFNKAGVAPIMHQPMARLLLMFKSYPMHQINFSAELIERAITHNEWEPLLKHMLAYITFAGMGASFLSGTGFDYKTQHPAQDLAQIPLGQMGIGYKRGWDELGGPPSAAFLDVIHGNIMKGAREVFVPEWQERIAKAADAPNPGASVLELAGFAR